MSKWQPHLMLIRGCVWASTLSSAQLNGIIRVVRHRRYVLISVSNEFGYLLIFPLYVSLLFNCFVICMYAAPSNCNIGCLGKSEGTVWHSLSLKIRYFLLTYVPALRSTMHLESPALASKELLNIILMALQHHSATKNIWLNNPQGFGTT